MAEKIYIGLVEDQSLFREGMKAILGYWQNIEVSFESDNGYSVVEKLKTAQPLPGVLLVDLSLPPDGEKEFSGMDVTDAVLPDCPANLYAGDLRAALWSLEVFDAGQARLDRAADRRGRCPGIT